MEIAAELKDIDQALGRIAPGRDWAALLNSVTGDASLAPLHELKAAVQKSGVDCQGDAFERLLLAYAMAESEPRIDGLPVHASVKPLIRREFKRFTDVRPSGPALLLGADPFVAAAKICTLRRFPAGPMDWVISGVPRSWFTKMPPARLLPALRYIYFEFGGRGPAFYVHLAHPPRNRSLVLEIEVRKSWYRMAASLALQPEVRGIACASWFHDPRAMEDAPHLASLNEPYLAAGGRIVTTLGEAPAESGFLKFSPERRARYQRGELKLMTTLAMWPRKAALDWAARHPELEDAHLPLSRG